MNALTFNHNTYRYNNSKKSNRFSLREHLKYYKKSTITLLPTFKSNTGPSISTPAQYPETAELVFSNGRLIKAALPAAVLSGYQI